MMITRLKPIAAAASLGILVAACSSPEAPTDKFAAAANAVAQAQAAGAGQAAPSLMTAAQEKLALARVKADDGDIEEARTLAAEARADATEALARAQGEEVAGAKAEVAQLEAKVDDLMGELEAKKTERGAVVTLGDVLFRTDSASLTPGGVAKVQEIAQVLRADPGQAVVIEGHADSTGDSAYNATLSERRAEAVASALLSAGVPTPRIVYTGMGENSPIASNATPLGRQMNRRVEVIFVDRG